MRLDLFKDSLRLAEPPGNLPPLQLALWWDARNNWEIAHHVAQEIDTPDGSWLHAYLHRKEGDESNAAYWYHRAGKPVCRLSLEQEWQSLAKAFADAGESQFS